MKVYYVTMTVFGMVICFPSCPLPPSKPVLPVGNLASPRTKVAWKRSTLAIDRRPIYCIVLFISFNVNFSVFLRTTNYSPLLGARNAANTAVA